MAAPSGRLTFVPFQIDKGAAALWLMVPVSGKIAGIRAVSQHDLRVGGPALVRVPGETDAAWNARVAAAPKAAPSKPVVAPVRAAGETDAVWNKRVAAARTAPVVAGDPLLSLRTTDDKLMAKLPFRAGGPGSIEETHVIRAGRGAVNAGDVVVVSNPGGLSGYTGYLIIST